jgi:hypothetical protein
MPRTEIYTYFTKPGPTRLLYTAEDWIEVILELQTAGPVAFSTRQEITPVLSGKGILLTTDIPRKVTLEKGDRIFIAAEAVNRVSFITQPFGFLQEIVAYQAAQLKLAGRIYGIPEPQILPPQRNASPPLKQGELYETGTREQPRLQYIPKRRGS